MGTGSDARNEKREQKKKNKRKERKDERKCRGELRGVLVPRPALDGVTGAGAFEFQPISRARLVHLKPFDGSRRRGDVTGREREESH